MSETSGEAERALRAMQRDAPPRYASDTGAADRVVTLARLLEPWPLPIMLMLGERRLVCGEVGDLEPDVRTRQVSPGQFIVIMTSGWMDFLHAISRAMAGASVMHAADGSVEDARALGFSEVADLVAETLRHWRKFCQPSLWDILWRKRRIETATFPVAAAAASLAEQKAECAEMFMIAHEFGHVALDAGLTTSPEASDELRADGLGMSMYLQHAQDRFGLRRALDGAAFAIRVTGSLARLGVRFAEAYLPPADRLQAVLAKARGMCPSEQCFDEGSTVTAANLELMDDIDARIGGVVDPVGRGDPWQARANLIGALQALVTSHQPPQVFIDLFAGTVRDLESHAARDLAQTLLGYYPPEPTPIAYLSRDIRAGMGQALRGCIGGLGAAERSLFDGG